MKEKLKQHLDGIFAEAPDTQKNRELKEEFYANLCDRYDEAIADGKTENEAYMISVRSLGDIHKLIGIEDPESEPEAKTASAEPKSEEKKINEDKKRRVNQRKKACHSVKSAVFMLILVIYFSLSFVTHAWGSTWIVFLINIAIDVMIDGFFELKEGDEDE